MIYGHTRLISCLRDRLMISFMDRARRGIAPRWLAIWLHRFVEIPISVTASQLSKGHFKKGIVHRLGCLLRFDGCVILTDNMMVSWEFLFSPHDFSPHHQDPHFQSRNTAQVRNIPITSWFNSFNSSNRKYHSS